MAKPAATEKPDVGEHTSLKCRACGLEVDADHEAPHDGGCSGDASKSHDFYGSNDGPGAKARRGDAEEN
jgi:hypothetical protein